MKTRTGNCKAEGLELKDLTERQKILNKEQADFEKAKADFAQQQQALSKQQQNFIADRQRLEASRTQIGMSTTTPQVPNINFFSTIGSLTEFRVGDDWEIYEERLNQYFLANSIPDDRRVAVLVTLIGHETYILKDLSDPILPSAKTYDELCIILRSQFAPKVAAFKDRREFFNLTQGDTESINDWYARIKAKAVKCKFGAMQNDKIKDDFVTGLKSGAVLDKVFEQQPTATLEEILEVARNKEAALAARSKQTSSDLNKIYNGSSKDASRRHLLTRCTT